MYQLIRDFYCSIHSAAFASLGIGLVSDSNFIIFQFLFSVFWNSLCTGILTHGMLIPETKNLIRYAHKHTSNIDLILNVRLVFHVLLVVLFKIFNFEWYCSYLTVHIDPPTDYYADRSLLGGTVNWDYFCLVTTRNWSVRLSSLATRQY